VYAFTGQLLYIFSFIILATTDHQSGVFAAALFAVVSYFLFQRNRFILTGVFVALAVLTKAYFLPLALTYGAFLLIKDRSHLIKYIIGGIFCSTLILLPFLLFTPNGLFKDVFSYSLTRGAGTNKVEVLQFFMMRDSVFFILLFTNVVLFKRQLFFSLFSFFSLIFIFLYQDIYYLYLNNVTAFLVLSFPIYQNIISSKMKLQKMVIPSFVFIYILLNFFIYFSQYRNLQTVDNYYSIAERIISARPSALYGTNDLTPLLAYDTHTSLLNNTIDTNGNIFRKGLLDAEKLTAKALSQRTIVVVHGVEYPQYKISDPILDEIVVKEKILKNCTLLQSYPVYAEGITNRLNLFQCFN
jgi:hypothetical protein